MYSKQEAAALRQQFWTAFGHYMTPVLSSEGEKVNWVNYKTGEKNIYFRMQADAKKAVIAIELAHKDAGILQLYYEQFLEVKKLFEATAGTDWTWQPNITDENGRLVSLISKEQSGVSIFRQEDWPALIRFFKQEILLLDEFWNNVKYSFESLR